MRTPLLLVLISWSTITGLFAQDDLTLNLLSRISTGIFDEGAAEIAAFDPGSARLFFTNGDADVIQVFDLADPANPLPVDTIDISPYGGGINSVAVFDGLVAAAVEADEDDQPGRVVFFDVEGNYINDVPTGVLPDMITFNQAGDKLLVANEGEPIYDSGNLVADPEGSVTIIDLANGAANADTTYVSFQTFIGKEEHLRNKGVRIFLPGANAAQDLEPEYIAVTPDDQLAYVSCQENNALIVVDIAAGTILDIYPLNEKDHSSGRPALTEFLLNELIDLPALGKPLYDPEADTIFLSGFSGLYFDPTESDEDTYVFYAIPDRGPNEAAINRNNATDISGVFNPSTNLRPFKLPGYEARIAKFQLELGTEEVSLEDQIFLRRMQGNTERPITGFGNIPGFDETPVTQVDGQVFTQTDWITVNDMDTTRYQELPFDPFGGDFEGIVRDPGGNFWMCDEYRPAIYQFSPTGMLLNRFVPEGAGLLGDFPIGPGTYGTETLPAVYNKRWANRGFEALALDTDEGILYAFIQSPMFNPDNSTRNNSDVIRILGIDPADGTPVSEYVYLLERNREPGRAVSRVDKIGDAVYAGNGQFLVLERDSGGPGENNSKKYVFRIFLEGATNILNEPIARVDSLTQTDTVTLEQLTADQLVNDYGIRPVHKVKVLNLPSIGYLPSDKPEGLTLLPDGSIAVLNDNDFGLAGAGVSDNSSLGIIRFGDDNSLDASNRDDVINITNHPTLGFFMPDAITAFRAGDEVFLLSANEGDARDYSDDDGFNEEERVGGLMLDPAVFSNPDSLQADEVLGRLNSTIANGDIDEDGMHEIIYSYGARSFTVWDAFGNQIWDSGNEFESVTAAQLPDFFNSNNDDNDSFDSRSDDKGPEPEAVATGVVGNTIYAFIGMERVGGIFVYDVTDPRAPQFVSYFNDRNFGVDADSPDAGDLGVEDLTFVPAEDSPNGKPLLIAANEVSGTVAIYGDQIVSVEEVALAGERDFRVFPNPTSQQLYTDQVSDFAVFNAMGQQVLLVENANQLTVSNLPGGTYIIRDLKRNQTRRFIVR